MKIKKQIMFAMVFLAGLFLISNVLAYQIAYPQYASPGSRISFFGGISDQEIQCEPGNDFLIQIAPFGCQPAVVRSDLLEEQDSLVLCQLSATKLNPLIKVEAINDISFSGKYPKEVRHIGFFPAKAALKDNRMGLDSGFMDNIGYIQIVLKQTKNESAMPESVSGDLTAKIYYDIENAFGIGKATYYLSEVSDEEWERNKVYYGLWNGRAFLKIEDLDFDSARISLYQGDRRLASANLKEGEESGMVYLPGFDCMAGLKLKLDDLSSPNTRARLDLNGEVVELTEGDKFLDNKCEIRRKGISKSGLVEKVKIKCDIDKKRNQGFTLLKSPRVQLMIDDKVVDCGEEKGCKIGDVLYTDKESNRKVFLSYIGENKNGRKFISLSITNHHSSQAFLDSYDYTDAVNFVANIDTGLENINLLNAIKSFGYFIPLSRAVVSGSDFSLRVYEGESEDIEFRFAEIFSIVGKGYDENKKIKFLGFSDPVDYVMDTEVASA